MFPLLGYSISYLVLSLENVVELNGRSLVKGRVSLHVLEAKVATSQVDIYNSPYQVF